MQKIAISGATGFLGSALLETLVAKPNFKVVGLCRSLPVTNHRNLLALGDLEQADFSKALHGVHAVIHTAAMAHVLDKNKANAMQAFRRVNVQGSLNLARQAVSAGVKRFIFISSIGVNGGSTHETPFSENSTPSPHSAYAQSKYEAEQALHALCVRNGMQLVIIRPPLIYAAHAPGNFARLLKIVEKRIPLPFARVNNRRSFIALSNLVDFILHCIQHPNAANELFVVADGQAISTAYLLKALGKGMNKPAILYPVPLSLMRFGANVLGRAAMFEQLCASLEINTEKAQTLLQWKAPVPTDKALWQTAQSYLSIQAK